MPPGDQDAVAVGAAGGMMFGRRFGYLRALIREHGAADARHIQRTPDPEHWIACRCALCDNRLRRRFIQRGVFDRPVEYPPTILTATPPEVFEKIAAAGVVLGPPAPIGYVVNANGRTVDPRLRSYAPPGKRSRPDVDPDDPDEDDWRPMFLRDGGGAEDARRGAAGRSWSWVCYDSVCDHRYGALSLPRAEPRLSDEGGAPLPEVPPRPLGRNGRGYAVFSWTKAGR